MVEALNYTLVVKAFGITDWTLKFGEIAYRDSVAQAGTGTASAAILINRTTSSGRETIGT